MNRYRFQPVALLLALLPVVAVAAPVGSGAVVSGFVRDAQGVPQMGALVQAMLPDATLVGRTFTDLHGHYVLKNLKPGRYEVKATAALYLPSMRGDLRLRAGAQAFVNLTLTTIFEDAQWLPAERRKPDEQDDDWRWTLRSAANRPILRLADDGSGVGAERGNAGTNRVGVEVSASNDTFGRGGVRTTAYLGHEEQSGKMLLVRESVSALRAPYGPGVSGDFSAVVQRPIGMMGVIRTRVGYQLHPEIIGQGGSSGLQSYRLDSGETMNFGDTVAVEVGSSLRAVQMGTFAWDTRPFLRVTAHPNETVILSYRMAKSRDLQGMEDLDSADPEMPLAVLQDNKLVMEEGTHQEWMVGVKLGNGTLQTSYYRDAIQHPMIAATGQVAPEFVAGGMLLDTSTSTMRLLGNSYNAQGWTLALTEPLGRQVWTEIDLDTGDALAIGGTEAQRVSGVTLHGERAKAATVAVRGAVKVTGTRVRASYRMQTGATVTPVNMFDTSSRQSYLSFSIRQPLRIRRFRMNGVEAFLDVANLLQQGYQPYMTPDGKMMVFAQSPRTLQAGLAFNF